MDSYTSSPIRLLLCDDHQFLTDAVSALISLDERILLVSEPTATGEDAVEAVAALHPDVVLMDIDLLGPMDGFEATAHIRTVAPHTKVVIMSGVADPDTALINAIEAGASGFLSKSHAASWILDAVVAAAEGESLVDALTLVRVLHRIAQVRKDRGDIQQRTSALTSREREILRYLAQGCSNTYVGTQLFISPHTVQTHTRNILQKLGVHSKLQAVALAARADALTA